MVIFWYQCDINTSLSLLLQSVRLPQRRQIQMYFHIPYIYMWKYMHKIKVSLSGFDIIQSCGFAIFSFPKDNC